MKKVLLAAALLCAPAIGQAQSFTAYETGDPSATGTPLILNYLASDWQFGHWTEGPVVLRETAYGFRYDGPSARLDRLAFRVALYEGDVLGVHFLEGPTRESAARLGTWEISHTTFTPSGIGVGEIVAQDQIALSSGNVYWLSFFAAGQNTTGWGLGVFFGFEGQGTTEYFAASSDRGQSWEQAEADQLLYRVTAVAVPEPTGVLLLLSGALGFAITARRRA